MEKVFYTTKKGKEYSVDIYGVIRNKSTGRIIKGRTSDGYLNYNLSKAEGNYHFRFHRVVAEMFIPNPENKKIVNHKDGNRKNNAVSNLEWVTHKENTRDAIERGTHPSCNLVSFPNIVRHMRVKYSDDEISNITGVQINIVKLVK